MLDKIRQSLGFKPVNKVLVPTKSLIEHNKYLGEVMNSSSPYSQPFDPNHTLYTPPNLGETWKWVKDKYGYVNKITAIWESEANKNPHISYEVKPKWYMNGYKEQVREHIKSAIKECNDKCAKME